MPILLQRAAGHSSTRMGAVSGFSLEESAPARRVVDERMLATFSISSPYVRFTLLWHWRFTFQCNTRPSQEACCNVIIVWSLCIQCTESHVRRWIRLAKCCEFDGHFCIRDTNWGWEYHKSSGMVDWRFKCSWKSLVHIHTIFAKQSSFFYSLCLIEKTISCDLLMLWSINYSDYILFHS